MFKQGMFTIDQNTTPEQLARKRAMIEKMMPQYGKAKYIGEGLGHLGTGIFEGLSERKMDKFESGKRDEATKAFEALTGGPMSILGMNEDWGRAEPTQPDAPDPTAAPMVEYARPNQPVQGHGVKRTDNFGPSNLGGVTAGQNAEDLTQNGVFAVNNPHRETLAKTLMAEAGGEGYDGMLAVGSVINNRVNAGGYGGNFNDVIMAPGQFSAWNGETGYAGGKGGLDMSSMSPNADAYRAADAILTGTYKDPTGGAENYYNPAQANPAWGGDNWQRIGNHAFGTAGQSPQASRGGQRGGPSMQDLQAAMANPWLSQEQKAQIGAMIQQNDPMRAAQLENLRLRNAGLATANDGGGAGAKVGAQEILEDGTIIQSTQNGPVVYSPTGERLEGEAAAAAITAARDKYTANQQSIFGAREAGKLSTQAELGAEAEGAKAAGKTGIALGAEAYAGYSQVQTNIGNISDAIAAIDAGADSGAVQKYLPNITTASASLSNAMDRMGLDIIGAVTFGALSEGELKLAMETAVPRDLDSPELKVWLVNKKAAQEKAAEMLLDAAQFLSKPGNTLDLWIEKGRAGKPPPDGAAGSATGGTTINGYTIREVK